MKLIWACTPDIRQTFWIYVYILSFLLCTASLANGAPYRLNNSSDLRKEDDSIKEDILNANHDIKNRNFRFKDNSNKDRLPHEKSPAAQNEKGEQIEKVEQKLLLVPYDELKDRQEVGRNHKTTPYLIEKPQAGVDKKKSNKLEKEQEEEHAEKRFDPVEHGDSKLVVKSSSSQAQGKDLAFEPRDSINKILKAVDGHVKQPALKLEDLQPPDHLDAVRMEQDGHLNRDYKKEIFLGNHEDFEKADVEQQKKKLTDTFRRVDVNRDDFIDHKELQDWIIEKIKEHFAEAGEENEKIFRLLDTDGDGHITWYEFHMEFLKAKGYDEEKAKKQVTDYESIPLDPDEKEKLIRFKFRWSEADEEPQDNKLNVEEFRVFRHPEQSEAMLKRMVQDIIENLDRDVDGIITEDEFAALPPGQVDSDFAENDIAWQKERRKEFRNVIDKNRDGKVGRDELKKYVDPMNPNHAKMEADNLIQLGDDNNDSKLTLNEVLDNMELFLGSKMVDTERSFHDEF